MTVFLKTIWHRYSLVDNNRKSNKCKQKLLYRCFIWDLFHSCENTSHVDTSNQKSIMTLWTLFITVWTQIFKQQVCLDFKTAIDLEDHKILPSKLETAGVSGPLSGFNSYLIFYYIALWLIIIVFKFQGPMECDYFIMCCCTLFRPIWTFCIYST